MVATWHNQSCQFNSFGLFRGDNEMKRTWLIADRKQWYKNMCHVLLCQVCKGCRLSEGRKNQRHATNANQLGQRQVIFRSCNDVQMTCNDTFSMLLGYILRTPPSLIALVSAFEFWNAMPRWKKWCSLSVHYSSTASLVEEQELVEVTFSFQLRGVSQRPWAVWLPSRDEWWLGAAQTRLRYLRLSEDSGIRDGLSCAQFLTPTLSGYGSAD